MAKSKDNRLQQRGTGKIVVAAVDRAVRTRWDQALERAEATSGTLAERVAQVERRFLAELVAVGAASGGSAAVPGVGTATAVGLTATELAWTASRTADMVLTVAAVHGITDANPDERKAWVLALMAFDHDGADAFTTLVAEMGGTVATSRMISVDVLERVNGRLGRTLIARYGARRSALIFGKLLPFGVGAVIGGAANGFLVRTMIRRADEFFTEVSSWRAIPPPFLPPAPATAEPSDEIIEVGEVHERHPRTGTPPLPPPHIRPPEESP